MADAQAIFARVGLTLRATRTENVSIHVVGDSWLVKSKRRERFPTFVLAEEESSVDTRPARVAVAPQDGKGLSIRPVCQ